MSERVLEIRIEQEFVATADLRWDVAPKTSKAIWDALPFGGSLMHCTSSGECVFFGVDAPLAIDLETGAKASDSLTENQSVVHGRPLVEPENLTCYVSRGDIVLTPDKACILVHGRRCVIRAYVGELPSNAFAMITDPKQLNKFEDFARRTLKEGAKGIEFRQHG
jgi:hypothetical protein